MRIKKAIERRMDEMADLFTALHEEAEQRQQGLEASIMWYQFVTDANEADSWMHERELPLCSDDLGKDELGTELLLKNHSLLEQELSGYDKNMRNLRGKCEDITTEANQRALEEEDRLVNGNGNGHRNRSYSDDDDDDDYVDDSKEIEMEEVEIEVEVEEEVVVTDNDDDDDGSNNNNSSIPVVKAMYNYKSRRDTELPLKKGQFYNLIEQTNHEWWSVEAADGQMGFVPANYVKIVENSSNSNSNSSNTKNSSSSSSSSSGSSSSNSSNKPKKTKKQTRIVKKMQKVMKPKASSAAINRKKKKRQSLSSSSSLTSSLARKNSFSRGGSNSVNELRSASEKAEGRMLDLETRFDDLAIKAKQRRKQLEDMLAGHQLAREMDQLESWLNDRVAIAQSDELGNDLEHTAALLEKFQDFRNDLATNTAKFERLAESAAALAAQGQDGAADVLERQRVLTDKWEKLQVQAAERFTSLQNAKEINAFFRDTDDTKSWIKEKTAMVSSDDYGKDLPTVQALLRRHNAFESEIKALGAQTEALHGLAGGPVHRLSKPGNARHGKARGSPGCVG